MKTLVVRSIAIAALAAVILWTNAADAQNGKTPSVKEAMAKLNKGPGSLCPQVGKAIKAEAPNWDEIQKESKQVLVFADALVKNDPPRGDKASWDKLTKAYFASAKELDDAAQKKDKNGAAAAHAKLASSAGCNGCHKAHRN
ncbi:MAG: cytochrome C [Planctomycetia bacterium]|nr:cytochrome C [Planctomycetia bacterium]